jgi:hypothetical protein
MRHPKQQHGEEKLKVSKVLYVGLGGTGIKTLLHTKRAFEEAYGTIPPTFGFLAFDTNVLEFDDKHFSDGGKTVLARGERGDITVDNAPGKYNNNKNHYPWMPSQNVPALRILKIGAGQVRTNGRFALIHHLDVIKGYINGALTSIQSAKNQDDERFEWNEGLDTVDVHLVFSIAGGTGCGTFIDMAYLIKKAAEENNHKVKIYGYAVLPDVFIAMNPDSNFSMKDNAFGALADLDYLLHNTSVSSKHGGKNITFEGSPFDLFFCIDNKNDTGDTTTDVNEIAEMIGNALCITSGTIGDASKGFFDNFETKIHADNSFVVKGKMSWICRIGACKIIFNADKAAKVFGWKASQKLIDSMLTATSHNVIASEKEADTWMSEIKIVETDKDDLINAIRANAYPESKLEDVDEDAPRTDIDMYYKRYVTSENPDLSRVLDVVQGEIVERVTKSLHDMIVKQVKDPHYPVYKPIAFLNRVKQQIAIYEGEMEKEKKAFDGTINMNNYASIPSLEAVVANAVEDLKELRKKKIVWNRDKKTNLYKESVCDAVYNVAKAKIDRDRRVRAITIYKKLATVVDEEISRLNLLRSYLEEVRTDVAREIGLMEATEKRYPGLFTINLASEMGLAESITVQDTDINIAAFVQSLGDTNLLEYKDVLSLKKVILQYADQLNGTIEWSNKTIDSILTDLKAIDLVKFKDVIRRATSKAKPILPINCDDNYNSGTPVNAKHQISQYLVGVPDENTCPILAPDDFFKEAQNVDDKPQYHSTGMSDRIIIYRVDGIIPAYAVGSVKSFRDAYDKAIKTGKLPHFDNLIFERMKREKFSIFPKDNDDEAYKYWVFGLIFDCFVKVRKEDGIYYYYNPNDETITALGKGWISTQTTKRKTAFDQFSSQLPDFVDKYEDIIAALVNTNSAAIIAKIQGAMMPVADKGTDTCRYLTEPGKYSKSPNTPHSVYVNAKSNNDATSKQIIAEIQYLSELLSDLGLKNGSDSIKIDVTL